MQKNIDFTFDDLCEPLVAQLELPPSRERLRKLCALFYPIWDAYLKYFLYANGVYDNDPEFGEYYNEIFLKCVEKLEGLKHNAPTQDEKFSMVKCYYKKCVEGWVKNAIVAERKGRARLINDPGVMALMTERGDEFKEVEHESDMKKVKSHLQEQNALCKELYSMLYEEKSRKTLKRMVEGFRGKVLEEYAMTGRLLSAQGFVGKRIGRIFAT